MLEIEKIKKRLIAKKRREDFLQDSSLLIKN